MNEALLQYIWKFQLFQLSQLATTDGQPLEIMQPGLHNRNQGPDFTEAMIRLGRTCWAGNIEVHICSSDFLRHGHETDSRYQQMILHVVWEEDKILFDTNGNRFPTLELRSRVPLKLLQRYHQMTENIHHVPCHRFLPAMDRLGWLAWKERLALERLERKSVSILKRLEETGYHWEELCWQLLVACFGQTVNTMLFEQVARTLPFRVLTKHRHDQRQLEALLLGQANLLAGRYRDTYIRELQQTFRFYRKKYQLPVIQQSPAFLRMRPASFPTVRMAQLATWVAGQPYFFARILEEDRVQAILQCFRVKAGSYWETHYRPDEKVQVQSRSIGMDTAASIVLNMVVPLLYSYGKYTHETARKEKAIRWLAELPSERNRVTRYWQQQGVGSENATDSQALLELTNYYCQNRLCLLCAAGNKILRTGI